MRNLLLAALLFTHFSVVATTLGDDQRLSLEKAVKLGLKRSEDVQQAAVEIQRAQAQIKEAWAGLLPQVSANIQAIRHTKSPIIQIAGNAAPIKEDWELLSSLQLNQVLYSFGRVIHALELARASSEARLAAKAAVEREIRYAVEVAYFNALSAQKILSIAKDSLENARKNRQALLKRFQGGRVPRFDNIKMASDIAGRAPLVSDAEKNLKLAFLQLNLLIEAPTDKKPILTSGMTELFPALQKSELLSEAYKNPSLKATELAVEIASRQAKLAKAEHYPVASLFGQLTHNGTGNSMPPDDENLFTSTAVGVSLNIPLFEGGAVRARHRQAALERTRAKIELKKQKETLEVELQSSIEEYKTNIKKYASAKKAVNLARQAYELTRSRFETGGATRNDLNDSERALTNARIQQQTALFEIYRNQASIKRFTQKVVVK